MKLEAMAELASFLENLLKTLIAAYSSLGQVAYYLETHITITNTGKSRREPLSAILLPSVTLAPN